MKKYIILANSTVNKGEKVALVDRNICKTQWWTNNLDKIMIFNTKELANKTLKTLKFNNPQIYTLENGINRLSKVAVYINNNSYGNDLMNKNREIGSVIDFD